MKSSFVQWRSGFNSRWFDPDAPGAYPAWDTGEERLVVTSAGMAIATDTDEEIVIRVRVLGRREGMADPETWQRIGSGRVSTREGRFEVGCVLAATTRQLVVEAGAYDVIASRNRALATDFLVKVRRREGI